MQTESVPSALDKLDRINKEADQLISNIGEDLGIYDASEPIETAHQIPKTSSNIPEQAESVSTRNAELSRKDPNMMKADPAPPEKPIRPHQRLEKRICRLLYPNQ
ncbi:MAG: hypothetical protein ACYSUZ_03800 [Planctomycetota bacterium]|jgi:hypothetical protein